MIYLGVYAGLRNGELRGLRGRHFERSGFIWVSATSARAARSAGFRSATSWRRSSIASGGRSGRTSTCCPRSAGVTRPSNREKIDTAQAPEFLAGAQSARHARSESGPGSRGRVYPHLLRHAFADHMVRHAGLRNAQHMMGHADSRTTEIYLGSSTPDELKAADSGLHVRRPGRTYVPIDPKCPRKPSRGAYRNRTGVNGFAGRCVATPPRRRKRSTKPSLRGAPRAGRALRGR